MLSKVQARKTALHSLLLQVSVAPRFPGWWLKYAWMQMLWALMVPVWCQWGALLQLCVVRRVPMGAEQARFSPRRTLLGCKFVLVKKCQRRELSCLLWQSVEQERAPVPLSGLRCWKVYETRATAVLWVPCCLFPGTTAALRLRFVQEILANPLPSLQMCSPKLAGKGEGKKSCWCYPRELCFLW